MNFRSTVPLMLKLSCPKLFNALKYGRLEYFNLKSIKKLWAL